MVTAYQSPAQSHPLLNLDDKLAERGILQACRDALWTPYTYHGYQGWKYPIYNFRGEHYQNESGVVWRWKNAEPMPTDKTNGWQKYAWIPAKPEKARYYLLPDARQAIADKSGVVYIASGEPDVMAYRAAGFRNVLCWLSGEISVPSELVSDLLLLGAKVINYYPDRDEAGMKSAAKVANLLAESELKFYAWQLPGDVGTKHDINWYWKELGFDANRFTGALYDAPLIHADDLYLYAQESAPKADGSYTGATSSELPQAYMDILIQHVENRPGFKRWDKNGWGNYQCDLHDDTLASAGFNRETGVFNCFVCSSKNAKDYGKEALGIEIKDYYPKPEPKADVRSEPKGDHVSIVAMPQSKPTPATATQDNPPRNDDAPLYADSHTVGLDLIRELRGELIPDVMPMEFPFKTFHRFGGFAEMLWPGKLVFISGVSGGGKTSMGETISEMMQKDGQDVIWYNPEWTAREMRIRALQRAGGMNMTRYARMLVRNIDRANNVPMEKQRGVILSREEQQKNIDAAMQSINWPGRVYTLEQSDALTNMPAILATCAQIVEDKRKAGRKVSAFFFDYIQRAPKANIGGWDAYEAVVRQIKTFCETHKLFGFIFLQPTKGASHATRDGDALTEASGQGLSDQQANLYFTMTPAFDANRNKLPYIKISLVKNSMGQCGTLYLKWAASHLAIVDEEINPDAFKDKGVRFEDD